MNYKTVLALCLWLFSMKVTVAQTQPELTSNVGDQWISYFENSELLIEVKKSDCVFESNGIKQQWLLFRYSNKTSENKEISFNYDLYYDDVCKTCNSDEYEIQFDLGPNEVLEGKCDIMNNKQYKYAFIKHLDLKNYSVLTQFNFSNLSIK